MRAIPPIPFDNSDAYWRKRYDAGGDSGVGSYGKFAGFKAEILNEFVKRRDINSVIEFGCGDGNQLSLARYPQYTGYDVSANAIERCRQRFSRDRTKRFGLMSEYAGEKAEAALSLDVIYHLVEDDVFERYMRTLFDAGTRYVIIYSSNHDASEGVGQTHVRHRRFTSWVDANAPAWELAENIPNRYPYEGDCINGSWADFYIFGVKPT